MNLPKFSLAHRSFVLAIVAVLLAIGVFNFSTMPRREDPEITIRDALVVTFWPGASAVRVDELVTDPLEELLLEIAEVETVESTSRVGVSIIQVTTSDAIGDTDQVWDDVRAKVLSARGELPDGVSEPFVDSDFGDVYEIVFALHQTPKLERQAYSARELEQFAEAVEKALERIDSVSRVEFWGEQPERVYVEFDSSVWGRLSLTVEELQRRFAARNIVLPGGEIDTSEGRFALAPSGEFRSVEHMLGLVVGRTEEGLPVQLGDLPVSIERRY